MTPIYSAGLRSKFLSQGQIAWKQAQRVRQLLDLGCMRRGRRILSRRCGMQSEVDANARRTKIKFEAMQTRSARIHALQAEEDAQHARTRAGRSQDDEPFGRWRDLRLPSKRLS